MPTQQEIEAAARQRRIQIAVEEAMRRVRADHQPPPAAPEEPPDSLATRGAIGRLTDSFRGDVREFVESAPIENRIPVEMAPSVTGTAIGGALGAPLGPVGIALGAIAGGAIGEFAGQSTGVSPPSDLALGLSVAAPVVGIGAAKVGQKIAAKGAGSLFALPAARAARANIVEKKFVEDFGNIGSALIAKQSGKGLVSIPSDDLFAIIRRSNIRAPTSAFRGTSQSLRTLRTELEPLSDFAAPKQAIKIIDSVLDAGGGGEIKVETVMGVRREVGKLVKAFERQSGTKLRTAKTAFRAIQNDLDELAKGGSKASRAARILNAANKRAKIEFAGDELETAIVNFTKPVPGEDALSIDANGLRKWLEATTNPRHKLYDKNFTEGAKDVLPEVKETLKNISRYTSQGRSPAGPGSIVVRGITAAGGGAIGAAVGGPVGAGAGALAGANAPDVMMRALMTPRGRKLLEKAMSAGKGEISYRAWTSLGQIAVQGALKASGETNGSQ